MTQLEGVPVLDKIPLQPSREHTSVAEDGVAPTAGLTRRQIFRGAAAAAALGIGFRVIDVLGGRSPAFAGLQCGTSGLVLLQNCGGADYPTVCGDGCAREPAVDSSFYCINASLYGSRHRSCGELNYQPGYTYDFAIRTDQCYTSTADGWIWVGVDGGSHCECQPTSSGAITRPFFACTDGYARGKPTGGSYGPWFPSICQTRKCGAG